MTNVSKTIVLVGLMGAGKSAIGSRLAEKLGCAFADSDELIEAKAGKSISDVFEQHGEPYFRELEYKMIDADLQKEPHVLATGGGAFIETGTRKLLLANALVVWLKADLDVLVDRVSRKNTRPLLESGDKRDIMENLMNARYPIYKQAHITVKSDEGPHEQVVDSVMNAIEAYNG